MNNFESKIIQEDWICALKPYQVSSINELISKGRTLEEIAIILLSKTGSDSTAPFGGSGDAPRNYFENIKEEMRKLTCGDDKYKDIREEVSKNWNKGKTYIAMLIAGSIAPHIGIVATVLLPIVTIILAIVATVGLNAWCSNTGSIT